MFDRERTCDADRTGGSGVDEKGGEISSPNENVDWYGLPDAVVDPSDPLADLSLFVRPLQLSLIL
jgi:hypothetical protein